jgi:uncharacterized protein YfiM (DUF2279 family)
VSRAADIAEAGGVVCDIPSSSVRGVLLQAFNTESTKEHGAARSRSDDESAQAVLQQSGMEIEKQPDAQAAHAEIGQHLRVVCRHKLGNRLDFNDHLAIDENVGAEAFVELDAGESLERQAVCRMTVSR